MFLQEQGVYMSKKVCYSICVGFCVQTQKNRFLTVK